MKLVLLEEDKMRTTAGISKEIPAAVRKIHSFVSDDVNGRWKKEGGGKPHGGCPPTTGVVALFLLCQNPRWSRPEALLEGSRILSRGRVLWCTFLPDASCSPPISCPNRCTRRVSQKVWNCTIAAKIITKMPLHKSRLGAINFVKAKEQSLYKTNSLACPFTNRKQQNSGGKITKRILWLNHFCNKFKNDYK